jgi:hypothetical protein
MDHSTSCARSAGFTLMEILVGLCLSLLLSAALVPLWSSALRRATGAADRVLCQVATHVATTRLERDLRFASAVGCLDLACGALLEATPTELVVLTRSMDGADRELVEWEITDGRIMRRRAPWTGTIPASFGHALYRDSKTVVEGAVSGTAFLYRAGETAFAGSVAGDELARVTAVRLGGSVTASADAGRVSLDQTFAVGR